MGPSFAFGRSCVLNAQDGRVVALFGWLGCACYSPRGTARAYRRIGSGRYFGDPALLGLTTGLGAVLAALLIVRLPVVGVPR